MNKNMSIPLFLVLISIVIITIYTVLILKSFLGLDPPTSTAEFGDSWSICSGILSFCAILLAIYAIHLQQKESQRMFRLQNDSSYVINIIQYLPDLIESYSKNIDKISTTSHPSLCRSKKSLENYYEKEIYRESLNEALKAQTLIYSSLNTLDVSLIAKSIREIVNSMSRNIESINIEYTNQIENEWKELEKNYKKRKIKSH